MTAASQPPELSGLDPTARHTWLLFTDWCAACDLDPLPADPHTVAAFLADHPARPGTHRRRVAAINAAHRQAGLSEPGRAHAVQQALASRRIERLRRLTDRLADTIAALPTTGWPHGMFGRRDALMLTLIAAGLTYTEISALRRGELRPDGEVLVIDSRRQWRLHDAHPHRGAAAVYDRWARVQALLDRHASTRMLAHYLDNPPTAPNGNGPSMLAEKAATQPLIVSIDRWGYTPLVPTAMAEQSIATVARAHLAGQAPSHRIPTRQRPPECPATPPQRNDPQSAVLDARSYQRGIAARRAAASELAAFDVLLDELGTRAEQLLADLAAIVDDATT